MQTRSSALTATPQPIAFVKTEQLVLDHFNESFAIWGLDLFLCTGQ